MKTWQWIAIALAGLYLYNQQNTTAASTNPQSTADVPIGIARAQLLYGNGDAHMAAISLPPGLSNIDAGGTTILAANQAKSTLNGGSGSGLLLTPGGG